MSMVRMFSGGRASVIRTTSPSSPYRMNRPSLMGVSFPSLPEIEHPLGLAHAALDGAGRHDGHLHRDAHHLVDLPLGHGAQRGERLLPRLRHAAASLHA